MEVTDDLVEKVARALWHDRWEGYGRPWELEPDREQNDYRGAARAALAAIEDAGWSVVPGEPTDEMTTAAAMTPRQSTPMEYTRKAYAAMLSARPRITGETK